MSEARSRRERPPSSGAGSPGTDDISIPLLTERLTLPPLDLDVSLPLPASPADDWLPAPTIDPVVPTVPMAPSKREAEPIEPAAGPVTAPAPATAASSGTHWSRIEIELRESILRGLREQLPIDVRTIVAEHLRDGIQALVDGLANDVLAAARASLEEIVDRAVKAELDRMRNVKRS